jgi:hypothetical protein
VYKDANGVAIAGYPVDFVAPSTIINVTTVATTVLTNAQVKALPTTPITLVAAPAAGLRVKLLGATLRTAFTAGAYTNVNTTFATLGLQDPSADWLSVQIVNDSSLATDLTDVTTVLGASALVVDLPVPYVQAIQDVATTGHTEWINPLIGMATANVNGTALVLAMDNNGSGALTGGNAANTMTVIVYYALESVV